MYTQNDSTTVYTQHESQPMTSRLTPSLVLACHNDDHDDQGDHDDRDLLDDDDDDNDHDDHDGDMFDNDGCLAEVGDFQGEDVLDDGHDMLTTILTT